MCIYVKNFLPTLPRARACTRSLYAYHKPTATPYNYWDMFVWQLTDREESLRSALEIQEGYERRLREANVKLEAVARTLSKLQPDSGVQLIDSQEQQLQVSKLQPDSGVQLIDSQEQQLQVTVRSTSLWQLASQ